MKTHICAVSDLHGDLPEIKPCDLVLICGDIVPLNKQQSFKRSLSWFKNKFISWCESLPCDKVIFIAGNHDLFMQQLTHQEVLNLLPEKVEYLFDSMIDYKGIVIYGTPWCINLPNWAFNTDTQEEYDMIPRCDIVISHQPPALGLVGTVLQSGFNYMQTFASYKLANRINEIQPKYSLCGHVHSGNHIPEPINGVTYVNVSIKDENYNVTYEPFYFEI